MKKKICFISQFPPPIHGLSKAVDTLYNSYLNKIFDFEKIDITKNNLFIINLIRILKSDAELFYFTISQSKGGNLRDLIILKILELRNKKCLVHLHGGYYRKLIEDDISNLQKKANYRAISKLAGTIVLSKSLKSTFRGMIEEDHIHVVPNCVDDECLMSDIEFNIKLKKIEQDDIKNVIYLSNFIRSKGYPIVLDLAKLEKKNHTLTGRRKFHFNFAGKFFDKQEEQFFYNYILENNIEEYVTYHGVISGESKKNLLKKCSIFMLPTRYPNEGQPISILEAMGNGMMIITTNHAGIPDIVKDDVNGIVMVNDDIELLYDKLNNISFYQFAINNRKEVMKFYRESMYLKHMEYYFDTI